MNFMFFFKYYIVSKLLSFTLAVNIVEEHEKASALIQEIYENYPEYMTKLLEYHTNMKKFQMKNETYRGYIRQMRRNNKYELLIADAYTYNFKNNVYESGKHPNTVLYQCDKAIRYCSGNPLYCEYHEGSADSNIILVSPHDGYLKPDSLPTRDAGCFINRKCVFKYNCENIERGITKDVENCVMKVINDDKTQAITKQLAEELENLTGRRPHIVMNNLHRTKVDMNRKKPLATFDHPETNLAYDDFHQLIERAKASFNGKRGLILDIHGNAQNPHWNMFGYGILSEDLDNEIVDENKSSIKSLAKHVNVSFDSLLRGSNSLSHLMEMKGYKTVPSKSNRHPNNRPYFIGDKVIMEHGSRNKGNVDAILVEIFAKYRKETTYRKFAKDLAKSVLEFMELNYKNKGLLIIKPNRNIP